MSTKKVQEVLQGECECQKREHHDKERPEKRQLQAEDQHHGSRKRHLPGKHEADRGDRESKVIRTGFHLPQSAVGVFFLYY